MPKNVQLPHNCTQLLAKQCSKFSKLCFNSMWTKNLQKLKLDLEKEEDPEVKLPTSTESQKKQENSRKTSTSALTTLNPLTVWITTNCGKFLKRWEYQTTWPASWNLYAGQEATVRIRHGMGWFQIGKGVPQVCIVSCHPAYLTYLQSTSCQARWSTN